MGDAGDSIRYMLSPEHDRILRTLSLLCQRGDKGLTIKEVRLGVGLDHSEMAIRAVAYLAEQGFATMTKQPSSRGYLVRVSPAGAKAHEVAMKVLEDLKGVK